MHPLQALGITRADRPQMGGGTVAQHNICFPVGRICADFRLFTHRIKTIQKMPERH